jgi:hypothetical protein
MAAIYLSMISSGRGETGLWCPVCLLPSRIRVPVYLTSEAGSSPLGTYDECQDCGYSPARKAA